MQEVENPINTVHFLVGHCHSQPVLIPPKLERKGRKEQGCKLHPWYSRDGNMPQGTSVINQFDLWPSLLRSIDSHSSSFLPSSSAIIIIIIIIIITSTILIATVISETLWVSTAVTKHNHTECLRLKIYSTFYLWLQNVKELILIQEIQFLSNSSLIFFGILTSTDQ